VQVEGECYLDHGFFIERFKYLKALGTPGLKKRATYAQIETDGPWTKVWMIEYEVEDASPLVN
jgi:hypothetical protein